MGRCKVTLTLWDIVAIIDIPGFNASHICMVNRLPVSKSTLFIYTCEHSAPENTTPAQCFFVSNTLLWTWRTRVLASMSVTVIF